MSLPHGFLDELRSRTSIAQVVGRKLSWDQRKSNPGKGDYWAPCPFHQEKTASFHVDDRKGFYYCFGCHAKGDALSFIRETENLGFMEAVELLAREAGMPVPERDPRAQEKADERQSLNEVMEQAIKFYRLQLKTGAASEARDYLSRRGLKEETLDRFEIGFAPDQRTALFDHLTGKGIKPEDLVAAGLCAVPEDGGQPYDRFRARIMYPIRDARGRAIAFGGRSMDPNARAKYLNSPETALFDKGRSLYHHGPAREAAGKAGTLIVAEGYMDVIALAQAGFDNAVAPLGTAITDDQLRLMWRMADEPVIALDGDKAGIRAAMRLIDIALPLLEAGKSLRFCILPEGLDPDDLIKSQGAKAMAELLKSARPMVDLLWQRETEDRVLDSPERRAALDAALRQVLGQIADRSIRAHYEAEIRTRRAELFRPKTEQRPQGDFRDNRWGRKPTRPIRALPGTRASLLAQRTTGIETEARVRESAILTGCINHPDVAHAFESELERLPFLCSDLAEIRNHLLSQLHEPPDRAQDSATAALNEALTARLGYDPLDKLMQIGHVRNNTALRGTAASDKARQAIRLEIDRQVAELGALEEIRDAELELSGTADEGLTWRLQQASAQKQRLAQAALGDDPNDTTDTKSLSEHLQSLIDGQVWVKRKK
jgi:DNA primase